MQDVDARHEDTADLIHATLLENPFVAAAFIAKRLGVSKTEVNAILYAETGRFIKVDETPPLWTVNPKFDHRTIASVGITPRMERHELAFVTSLHPWQSAALVAWQANGCRGIVNAVTGAGKTRLALAAIEAHRSSGGTKTAVIVPTIELLRQWSSELAKVFPDVTVGELGGGRVNSLVSCDILVAVVNSASQWQLGLEAGQRGLLVGDECHRLASTIFSQSLEEGFECRLGLSATHERMDGLHEEVLIPYFGQVVYELTYGEAIAQDVIAHVKVATLGVRFTARETAEYEQLTDDMREARRNLQRRFGLAATNTGEFFNQVNRLAGSDDERIAKAAKKFLFPYAKRRKLLSETHAKMGALPLLAEAVGDSNGTIAFTQSIESTDMIVEEFTRLGICCASIHSKLKPAERGEIFQRFASGDIKLISAPQVLDEGIDVPEADLAIIVSSTSQRRQMVQRMGRVMRKKPDGRQARFVLLYVRDTLEDPLLGAQESFFDEVLDIADETRRFDEASRSSEIRKFLSPT